MEHEQLKFRIQAKLAELEAEFPNCDVVLLISNDTKERFAAAASCDNEKTTMILLSAVEGLGYPVALVPAHEAISARREN